MVRLKKIFVEGDSWTSGAMIDPKLVKKGITYVNDKSNDKYRLPKVWPHKLGKLLNVPVENLAVAGSSNDGIIRRLINNLPKILSQYKPEEIFLIIGWSSPERKDFFRNKNWDTVYPAEIPEETPSTKVEKFQQLYADIYWNDEEYITRYLHHVILIHNYLENLGIKHIFFNSFYENTFGLHNGTSLISFIKDFQESKSEIQLDLIEITNTLNSYTDIYDTHFVHISYLRYLKKLLEKDRIIDGNTPLEKYLFRYHPTEYSHQEWAHYISTLIPK